MWNLARLLLIACQLSCYSTASSVPVNNQEEASCHAPLVPADERTSAVTSLLQASSVIQKRGTPTESPLDTPKGAKAVGAHAKSETSLEKDEKALAKDRKALATDIAKQPKKSKAADHPWYAFSPWWITRHPQHLHEQYHKSVMQFLHTARFLDIVIILGALALFIWMYGFFLKWPDSRTPHWVMLLGWICVGMVCMSIVYVCDGGEDSIGWGVGYLLELVFSVENVFVFHVVCEAFKAPTRLTQKALFAVIIFQVLFQWTFFMGLAHWIHHCVVLPYILGVWLLYAGYQAARGHSDEDDFDARDSSAFKFLNRIMGTRLSPEFTNDGQFFFFNSDGLLCCTMLLPLAIALIVVDVAFEVDVTLTKIETLKDTFSDFSSSVVAAAAVPELYFVARNMFHRYEKLQYGIAFILLFYGVQLLLESWIKIPAIWGIALVIGVMMICIALSPEKPMNPKFVLDTPRKTPRRQASDDQLNDDIDRLKHIAQEAAARHGDKIIAGGASKKA